MSLRNRFALPFAILSLAFLAACGGSGGSNTSNPPPSGTFGNSNFSGTYTFSIAGYDSPSGTTISPLSIAGTIMPSGNGTISAGTVDITDTSGPLPAQTVSATGSSYTINPDGTGTITLNVTTSSGNFPFMFALALTDAAHGLISEYDGNGTGSGTIDLQPSAVSLPNSTFAFSLSGSDTNSNPLAAVGGFTLSSGTITGLADFNFANAPSSALSLSGSISAGSGTSPGSATLISSFAPSGMTFSVYAIDATHLKLIENDGKAVLVGDVFSQPTATFPSATLSFTMADVDVNTQTALAVGGTINSDGSSMLTSGAEDFNNAGTIDNGTTTSTAFSGSFVASPSSNTNGRFQVSLSNFLGGGVFAAYPSSGGILMLEIDSGLGAGITGGVAMAQSSPTGLVASQGYGMNLTGIDIVNGTGLDQVAQFDTTSSNLTHGTIFYNDFGIANPNDYGVSNSSTYTPGSGGTGEAVLNFNGGSEAAVYYGVNSTTSLALGVDSGDVSLGVIEQQGSPTSTADVAQRHLALLKASALAHAARKKKQQ